MENLLSRYKKNMAPLYGKIISGCHVLMREKNTSDRKEVSCTIQEIRFSGEIIEFILFGIHNLYYNKIHNRFNLEGWRLEVLVLMFLSQKEFHLRKKPKQVRYF
jgi:hypothetical protein